MAVYNVKVDLYIDGATNSDAWAKGLVENVVDYTKALGGQAAVVVGTAGERNSYATSGVVDVVTQEFTIQKAWHVNDLGLVVDGLPDGSGTPPAVSEWSGTATYAIDDVVTYLGVTYRCIQPITVPNPTWTPDIVPALWAVM